MYESRLHPNPSKSFPYTVVWRSSIAYLTCTRVPLPEQTEFTTIDEVKEICKKENLKAKIYNQKGWEMGTAHEDGSYNVY